MEKLINILKHEKTLLIFRWIVGIIFIYSSLHKIPDTVEFAHTIQNYKLFPYELTNLAAMFMSWLQFLTGLFLIIGTMVRATAAILTILLNIFLIMFIILLIQGRDIHCGCLPTNLSADLQLEMILNIIRNVILVGMTITIFKFTKESTIESKQRGDYESKT